MLAGSDLAGRTNDEASRGPRAGNSRASIARSASAFAASAIVRAIASTIERVVERKNRA
jgi:hypothetical protein